MITLFTMYTLVFAGQATEPGPGRFPSLASNDRLPLAAPVTSKTVRKKIGPRIVCDQPNHDFGVVEMDRKKPLTHAFELRNEGDTVAWVRVRGTCNCSHSTEFVRIEPGGTAKVPAKIYPSVLKHGTFIKSLAVKVYEPPFNRNCRYCKLSWDDHPPEYCDRFDPGTCPADADVINHVRGFTPISP